MIKTRISTRICMISRIKGGIYEITYLISNHGNPLIVKIMVQTMEGQLKPNAALQLSKIPLAGRDAEVEFRTI